MDAKIEALLQSCCTVEKSRYSLDKPFHWNGYLCATDGRIAVRVPDEGHKDSDGVPPMDTLPWTPKGKWWGLPDDMPEITGAEIDCDMCDGLGRIETRDCRECNGVGECDNCGHYCIDCEGEGILTKGVQVGRGAVQTVQWLWQGSQGSGRGDCRDRGRIVLSPQDRGGRVQEDQRVCAQQARSL